MKVERGDIWLVNLEPTIGAEIRKTRPVVVIGSDAMGLLPIRLVAPLTGWKEHFSGNLWHVKVAPDRDNGLAKTSAVDAIQLRGVDLRRFMQKLGHISPTAMRSIIEAIAVVIEY
jgi:mRNA interferase MazF